MNTRTIEIPSIFIGGICCMKTTGVGRASLESVAVARAVIYAETPEYDSVVMFNTIINFTMIAVLSVICLIVGAFFFARSEKTDNLSLTCNSR